MPETRVATLDAPKRFTVGKVELAPPADGEVLVRVRDCGVCGSDLKMWAGTHAFLRPPLQLGHEIYGVVEEIGGAPDGFELGASVVVFPPIGCDQCYQCRTGHPQLCADMRFVGGQLPGGLAERVVVPAANLLRVPDRVPEHQRVLVEPLAVAVHAVSRAAVVEGEGAVVVGAGAIGLFTALVARARGLAGVVVGEPSPARRQRAEALGLTTFDPREITLADAVAALIRPEGADVVFECVGSQDTIAAALAATRKGGRTVIVGNAPASLEISGLELQRGDRSLVGVLMYELSDLIDGMDLLAGGLLGPETDETIVQPYALDEVGEAFTAAKDGTLDAVRAVVRP
ncbi:MAG: alcohol dehydrogenase catalytic domain-containing protein [Gaiellales bacterium]